MAKAKRRRRARPSRRAPAGSPPGLLTVDPEAPPPECRAIAYGPDALVEVAVNDLGDLPELRRAHPVLWLDVIGLGDADRIAAIGRLFGLHPLALEDVVHVHQRPKLERYPGVDFLVARMPSREGADLDLEQVSLFLGEGFVVTFQERAGDAFEPVRERLRAGRGRIRSRPAGYLAYALVDALVDSAFPILETFGEELEELETVALTDPTPDLAPRIHRYRRDLMLLRRAFWPLREAVAAWLREGSELLEPEDALYLRDCVDHAVQIAEIVESQRELCSGLMDLYLTSVSNRMNEAMKVLTVIATIFIPLSFVAGVYGMNFDTTSPWNMPELRWRYGYPATLAFMVCVALAMLWWFRRRRWL